MKNFIFLLLLWSSFINSASASDAVEIELHIKNHKFEPEEVRAITGKKIKMTIYNDDDSVEEFESYALKREKIVPAHGKAHIVLPPMKAGIYPFFGDFNQDTAQGRLIVE